MSDETIEVTEGGGTRAFKVTEYTQAIRQDLWDEMNARIKSQLELLVRDRNIAPAASDVMHGVRTAMVEVAERHGLKYR